MKNVHVLSTEKLIKSAGDLVRDKYGSIHIFTKNDSKEYGKTTTKLNIYITSDEGIKEGDWFIHPDSSCFDKEWKEVSIGGYEILQVIKVDENFIYHSSMMAIHKNINIKKIILTTDQDLIKDGVQDIDDEFLEWFVKNSSCEFVDTFIDAMGCAIEHCNANPCINYKIIIPQEEPNYNMKNVHLLPTDKPSRLYQKENRFQLSTHPAIDWYISSASYKPVNIYITSDEEIKEGDWYNYLGQITKRIRKNTRAEYTYPNYQKIILTTNQDLINDGVQPIDDEFLEWFVKNPSCEFVEVDKNWNYPLDKRWEYKIMIPKKEPTIEEEYLKDELKKYDGIGVVVLNKPEELKTSEEWQNQFPNPTVLDPDGWNRKNYQYSWFEEKITLAEYESRLSRSTVKGHILQEELKHPKVFSENGNELFFDEQGNIIREEPDYTELLQPVGTRQEIDISKYIMGIDPIDEQEIPKTNLERLPFPELIKEFAEYYKNISLVEEPKQETLEEAADKYGFRVPYDGSNDFYDKEAIKHFIAGAKWQAERMYSEEDLREAFKAGEDSKEDEINGDGETSFNEWFEQFKKK